MSERTHLAILGPKESRTIPDEGEGVSAELQASDLHFWRVLDLGGQTLISAQAPEPGTAIALREASEMLRLEAGLLRHLTRLHRAEQKIGGYVRERRISKPNSLKLLEMERSRTARELHTGVGQLLAAIRLQLEIISRHYPGPSVPVQQALDHIGELADIALQQVRAVSQKLHPPEWQRLSLPAALQQLWAISGIPQKFDGSLRIESVPDEPDPEVKVLLYRAAQEALSNLIRHSQASRLDAVLQMQGDRLVLSLLDNGIGFDAGAYESAPPNLASGIGLRSVREMAVGLGGELMVESGSVGTKLVVSVPCFPTGR